ncbi:hypothetical protein HDU83_000333 [Entophlyctis luteolus]|nr:hypothetical protein HDU83_000333 [Entophlyctis luteolus]
MSSQNGFLNEPLVQRARLGFGAMGLSMSYGTADRAESLALLAHLVNNPTNAAFIDTADVYGLGHNEELIGEWLASDPTLRSRVFLCTKFGFKSSNPPEVCGTPEYVKSCCNASIKRLGVEYIDLYYQHRVDPKTPIEDTVTAMAELVKEGKVRYIGLSEASADTIRRAHKVHPISAVQVEYSPWSTDIEQNGVLETCKELGIAIVAFSPLGRGFLTGQYKSVDDFEPNDVRRNHPRFMGDAFQYNLQLVDSLAEIAASKGVTVTQFVLAWVMAQGPHVIPIPGTKKISRLDENLGALNVVVTKEDDARVRAVLAKFSVSGDRYPPAQMVLYLRSVAQLLFAAIRRILNPRSASPFLKGRTIVCISDSHGRHRRVRLPETPKDAILVHAGDFTVHGSDADLDDFNAWLGEISSLFEHRIVVLGNHEENAAWSKHVKSRLTNAIVLRNEACMIDGVRIFGTDFYWPAARGSRNPYFDAIDDPVDVLITHAPPYGYGDYLKNGVHVGCRALLETVRRLQPALVVSGHVHSGVGTQNGWFGLRNTRFVNAATVYTDSATIVRF